MNKVYKKEMIKAALSGVLLLGTANAREIEIVVDDELSIVPVEIEPEYPYPPYGGSDGIFQPIYIIQEGKDGRDGVDGKNAVASVKDNGDGTHIISIIDGNGNETSTIMRNGRDGVDGKSITVAGSKTDESGNTVVTLSNGETSKDITIAKGKDGVDGRDGISSTVKVNKVGNVTTITTTDINGTTTVVVKDGKDGKSGKSVIAEQQDDSSIRVVTIDLNTGEITNVATINSGKDANLTFAGDNGKTEVQKSGATTLIKGDNKNISTSASGNSVSVTLKDDLEVNSVKLGDATLSNKGITIKNGNASKDVSLTKNGLNNGGNRITNVADGQAPTDAANIRQLNAVKNEVRNLDTKVNKIDNKLRAGIAQVGAMANIPAVSKNGGAGIGVGVANYRGESAVSLGYSKVSDNGRHLIKGSVSFDSRGYGMTGAGYTYQW